MVRGNNLLVFAGIIWLAAGTNVGAIGIGSYLTVTGRGPLWVTLACAVGSFAVFTLFHTRVFTPYGRKHALRIASYGIGKIPFWKFLDKKGYIMMSLMMSFGIVLRISRIMPAWFIASFYTGLALALMICGATMLFRRKSAGWGIASN